MSAFDLFNMSPAFQIDFKTLNQRYETLMQENHPDRFSNPCEKKRAQYNVEIINQAYNKIQSPITRLHLLLDRMGVDIKTDDEKTIRDPEILMEQMEIQEAIESIGAEKVNEIIQKKRSEIEICIDSLYAKQDQTALIKQLYRLSFLMKTQSRLQF